jgi:hypothetical protein
MLQFGTHVCKFQLQLAFDSSTLRFCAMRAELQVQPQRTCSTCSSSSSRTGTMLLMALQMTTCLEMPMQQQMTAQMA